MNIDNKNNNLISSLLNDVYTSDEVIKELRKQNDDLFKEVCRLSDIESKYNKMVTLNERLKEQINELSSDINKRCRDYITDKLIEVLEDVAKEF